MFNSFRRPFRLLSRDLRELSGNMPYLVLKSQGIGSRELPDSMMSFLKHRAQV